MTFFTYLFYMVALLPICIELVKIKKENWLRIKEITHKKSNMSSNQKVFVIISLIYLIWIFVGFFTSQWVLFGVIFLMSIVMPRKYYIVNVIDSILSLGLIFFIILNKFHLHLDLNPF